MEFCRFCDFLAPQTTTHVTGATVTLFLTLSTWLSPPRRPGLRGRLRRRRRGRWASAAVERPGCLPLCSSARIRRSAPSTSASRRPSPPPPPASQTTSPTPTLAARQTPAPASSCGASPRGACRSPNGRRGWNASVSWATRRKSRRPSRLKRSGPGRHAGGPTPRPPPSSVSSSPPIHSVPCRSKPRSIAPRH